MKFLFLFLPLLASFSLKARDLTSDYYRYYSDPTRLSEKDLGRLSKRELVLVPGILSEVFSWEDRRVLIDFSFLTSDYFAAQVKHLKYNLNLPTRKLLSSSKNVEETKDLIEETVRQLRSKGKRGIFITHSLGGLALLDYLLETPEGEWDETIEGVLFLQTPFYGSPIATVFLNNPYHADKWLRPFLPFFNTSIETVRYLSVDHRTRFMEENEERIREVLTKIPVLTMSGVTNGHKTIFEPAVDVMKHGCLLNTLGRCFTQRLFQGPYDDSDGMVPLRSSQLRSIDSVVLHGVDHGEPIVRLPYQETSKEIMTESLIKLLLHKLKNP